MECSESDITNSSPEQMVPSERPIKRNRERTWLPCEICGKKFDRPSLLKRHMRTHTGMLFWNKCPGVYGFIFLTIRNYCWQRCWHMFKSMFSFLGEKPHACDVCGKAFSTSSSLNTHRRIHSGEKPHVCKVCGKRFTASSNLYYHRMTHDKVKLPKLSYLLILQTQWISSLY